MPRRKKGISVEQDAEQEEDVDVRDGDKQDLDLYQVLGVDKAATTSDIRQAYRRLAIQLHPDKNGNNQEATEQFQQLQRVYSILSDPEKRRTYDATGSLELSEEGSVGDVWGLYQAYKATLQKVTTESIDSFFSKYEGSAEERQELIDLYLKHKGKMNMVLEYMISRSDEQNEHRFMDILEKAIAEGSIKTTTAFTRWAKSVAAKPRPKTPSKRKKQAETDENALVQAIRGNVAKRYDSAIDALAAKYCEGGKKKAAKGSGVSCEPPSEDEFAAARQRLEARAAAAASTAPSIMGGSTQKAAK